VLTVAEALAWYLIHPNDERNLYQVPPTQRHAHTHLPHTAHIPPSPPTRGPHTHTPHPTTRADAPPPTRGGPHDPASPTPGLPDSAAPPRRGPRSWPARPTDRQQMRTHPHPPTTHPRTRTALGQTPPTPKAAGVAGAALVSHAWAPPIAIAFHHANKFGGSARTERRFTHFLTSSPSPLRLRPNPSPLPNA
jgi:hypothetical protein